MKPKFLFFIFLFSFSGFVFCQGDSVAKIKVRSEKEAESLCSCNYGCWNLTDGAQIKISIWDEKTKKKIKNYAILAITHSDGIPLDSTAAEENQCKWKNCRSLKDSSTLIEGLTKGKCDFKICAPGYLERLINGVNLVVGDNAPLNFSLIPVGYTPETKTEKPPKKKIKSKK